MGNYGLILKKPKPQDWRFGGVTGIKGNVLQEDGQWGYLLPDGEYQHGIYFDTMACVTFSALNCLEVMMLKKHYVSCNFSDRYTATMSGTTKNGNYLYKVGDSIRKDGLVYEKDYPYPRTQRTPVFDWGDYYQPVPPPIKGLATRFKNEWKMNYEWVTINSKDDLCEALKYAPIQIVVHAWGTKKDGVFQRTTSKPNHAVMAFGYKYGEYIEIYDHYESLKKKLSWDYLIYNWGMKYNIDKNMPEKPTIKNNSLVQLVEGLGGFGFYLDGNIIIDDLANILATNEMRNKEQNTCALTQEQWDMFDKVNLKGEPINS